MASLNLAKTAYLDMGFGQDLDGIKPVSMVNAFDVSANLQKAASVLTVDARRPIFG